MLECQKNIQKMKKLEPASVRLVNISVLNKILPRYRLTVLKTLPNLEKLDDVVVQPEEVEDAQRKGRILVHPDEMDTLDPIYVRQSVSPHLHQTNPN